ARPKFHLHGSLVHLLQETVSKDRVHLECRADDLFGDLPVLERHGSCTPIAVTPSLHPIRVQSAFNPWLSISFSVFKVPAQLAGGSGQLSPPPGVVVLLAPRLHRA